jgi:uncharacterized heparinase superfamily protein
VTEGVEADLWWAAGCQLLEWQLDEQFLDDGGHFERSGSYHVALTAALLQLIELAGAGGRRVPEVWHRCARRAVAFIARIAAPDGTYPLFNDAALDAAPSPASVIALARVLGFAETGATPALVHLSTTGWVIARNSRATLALDVGADGAPYCPGHAHADALTIEFWLDGRRTIVDFGVAAYGEGAARTRTRSTAVHNTIQLAHDLDSAEVWGSFRVGRRSRAALLACEERDGAAVIRAENRGYAHLRGSPVHTRRIRLTERSLTIEDAVSGRAEGWVSRLRFDDAALERSGLEVTATGPLTVSRDHWHGEHGRARNAVVYEQSSTSSCVFSLHWR